MTEALSMKPVPSGQPGRIEPMKVFLSVGATYSKDQERFVRAFEEFLVWNGCQELTVGRDQPRSRQPILEARELMETADAVVVLAFTRYFVERALEYPGSKAPARPEIEIKDVKYPTVWNQLEAAMAFGLKLPLLVILENGLHQEAMLKDRLEFRVVVTRMEPGLFESDEFKGRFAHFKKIALDRARSKKIVLEPAVSASSSSLESKTIGELLKLFKDEKPEVLIRIGTAAFGLFSAVAAAAFWLGKNIG